MLDDGLSKDRVGIDLIIIIIGTTETKEQESIYRDSEKVEYKIYDSIASISSHWNSNEKLKEKFGNCTRKTFDRFTTKDNYIWNITHNTECIAM